MKKLLYITNGIKDPGGLERVLSVKASWLADHFDYEVHILVLNNKGAKSFYHFSEKIKIHDIPVNGNPFRYFKLYTAGIKKVVREIKPDIISVCDDGLKGFFLPMILGKPCLMIYERHVSKLIELGGNPSLVKKTVSGLKFWLMAQLGKRFDRFVVLTKDNLKEWRLKNAIVISNPLSFYPETSSRLENKKVIAVGKQGVQKGYDRLLKAWQTVSEHCPDWQLEIYGKIAPEQGLDALAKQLGIEKSVSFFPPVADIQGKYLESSVYVMSSRFEGFGMVLIEAMACGVPCVTFDCPYGPADIVSHNQDGLVVPNHDIEALADAIQTLIEDENLRKKMGANAKENVKRFLPETIVSEWDRLFKSLTR